MNRLSSVLAFQLWLGALLCAVAAASASQVVPRDGTLEASWQSSAEDLCGVYGARVALLQDGIYMMSGRYTLTQGDTNSTKQTLFLLSLNQSFPLGGAIPGRSLLTTTALPESPWRWEGGAFLYDETVLYFYAGLDEEYKVDGVWGYDLGDNFWKPIGIGNGNFQVGIRRDGMYASNPTTGLSFFSGGSDTLISGMLILDTSSHASRVWNNDTSFKSTPANSNLPGPQRMGGEAVFLPYGKKGVLLYIGGYDVSRKGSSGNAWDTIALDLIDVYDVDKKSWYRVKATGDVPSDRSEFCHWLSPAQDRSSYQITIYGGWDSSTKSNRNDIYVLTIPGFEWVSIGSSKDGRRGQRCVTWKESFGFLVGGIGSNGQKEADEGSCQQDFPPVSLLNLTSFEWQDNFDNTYVPAYAVPSTVVKVIGGNGAGGATRTAPASGWTDSAVASLFGGVNDQVAGPTPTTGYGGTPPTGTSKSSPTSGTGGNSGEGSGPSRSNTAAIAGGVAGGIVALLLLVGLGIFLVRRKRRAVELPNTPAQPPVQYFEKGVDAEQRPAELWTRPTVAQKPEMDSRQVHELPSYDQMNEPDRDSNCVSVNYR